MDVQSDSRENQTGTNQASKRKWLAQDAKSLLCFPLWLIGFKVLQLHCIDCAASVNREKTTQKNTLIATKCEGGKEYLRSLIKVTAEIASIPYSMSAIATNTGAL